ncbi:hypothetical protein [Amycolatopsis sp. NPDC051128]|uniref:hypothetical protein n=1 Tax=Amycolatopsis sp. NPDC051128 TaxID=3155412 RepID=UPI00341A30F2
MSPIRVLVVDMAELNRDIVQRIVEGQPDMTVVRGGGSGPGEAEHDVRGVDVVLVSASELGSVQRYLGLMWTHSRLGVVVVDLADRRGLVRSFRGEKLRPGQVGAAGLSWPECLLKSIRSAAMPGGG